jgi:hypothetical protein
VRCCLASSLLRAPWLQSPVLQRQLVHVIERRHSPRHQRSKCDKGSFCYEYCNEKYCRHRLITVLQVGELVLFLENVRNACKAASSKSAFRLKAQSSRESTAWALALDSAISQSAVARIPAAGAFPPITDNIFDKYKQTEVHRHNQQSQIHSAVSAKSGNESTASSAVQSQQGHAVAVNFKAKSDFPLDLSVQVMTSNFNHLILFCSPRLFLMSCS